MPNEENLNPNMSPDLEPIAGEPGWYFDKNTGQTIHESELGGLLDDDMEDEWDENEEWDDEDNDQDDYDRRDKEDKNNEEGENQSESEEPEAPKENSDASEGPEGEGMPEGGEGLAEGGAEAAGEISAEAGAEVAAEAAATAAAEVAAAEVETTAVVATSEIWGPILAIIAGVVIVVVLVIIIVLAFMAYSEDSATADTYTGSIGDRVAQISLTEYEKGVHENNGDNNTDPNIAAYQLSGGGCYKEPWCAAFVSYAYQKAGAPEIRTCGALAMISLFGDSSHLLTNFEDATPQPGDVVYRPRKGGSGHVGIVYELKGDILYTIEGNASDALSKNEYHNGGRDSWSLLGRY